MNSEWVKTEIANTRQREIREKRQILFPISLVPFEKIREWKALDADTGIRQRLLTIDVEVVHHQMNRFGCRVRRARTIAT